MTNNKQEDGTMSNPEISNYYLTKTIENNWGIAYWDGKRWFDDVEQNGKIKIGIDITFIKEWYPLPPSKSSLLSENEIENKLREFRIKILENPRENDIAYLGKMAELIHGWLKEINFQSDSNVWYVSLSNDEIEMQFPCEIGQKIIMEEGLNYDETRQANYFRRQGAKWMREKILSISSKNESKAVNENEKLSTELKDGDETLVAKLRNALSPHYGLPSVISKLREHPEILSIIEKMANQALENNYRIDAILDALTNEASKGREVEFAEWILEQGAETNDDGSAWILFGKKWVKDYYTTEEIFKIFLSSNPRTYKIEAKPEIEEMCNGENCNGCRECIKTTSQQHKEKPSQPEVEKNDELFYCDNCKCKHSNNEWDGYCSKSCWDGIEAK